MKCTERAKRMHGLRQALRTLGIPAVHTPISLAELKVGLRTRATKRLKLNQSPTTGCPGR